MLTNLVNKPAANRRHLYEAGRRLGESGEKSGQFWSTFLLYIHISGDLLTGLLTGKRNIQYR